MSNVFQFKPFSRKQRKVLNWWTENSPVKDYDGIIADGSIRSGKSVSMSLSYVMWAMENYQYQSFGMAGKTISAFGRNVLRWLRLMLVSRGYTEEYKRGDNLLIVHKGAVENYFYVFGGKDESSQDLIQGITLAGMYFDEVALMPESFVNQATGRCSVDGAKLWFNCNPAGPSHWFKESWIDAHLEKNLLYLHFTMEDNLSLSEKVKARYRTMYSGVFYDRYIRGLWALAEGLIYQNYAEALKSPPSGEPDDYVLSIDYGTLNAFAGLLWAKYGDAWYVVREYYYSGREKGVQKTDQDYAEDMNAFIDPVRQWFAKRIVSGLEFGTLELTTIVDPSAASFIALLRKDYDCFKVRKGKNEVVDGIRQTAVAMNTGLIKIAPTAKNLIKELQGYVWDERSVVEAPLKENDHACITGDSLMMTEHGNVPIRELVGKTGKVWSLNTKTGAPELKVYRDVRCTKKRVKIFKVTLNDGKTIRCTEDHPVLTERGYVLVKYLLKTDRIIEISLQNVV